MSSSQNKFQKERNQKQLLELASQPGNNICADCKARLPRWASHSLGIFICVKCAVIHRKIGTHITKVKSLTMDDWSKEQIEFMKSMGNERSNSIYNPNELRHPPPVNIEDSERDSEIEQYIRSKYEYRKFIDRSALVASRLGPSRSASTLTPRTVSSPHTSSSQATPSSQPASNVRPTATSDTAFQSSTPRAPSNPSTAHISQHPQTQTHSVSQLLIYAQGTKDDTSDSVFYSPPLNPRAYWIAAEHALQHARSKISSVSEVFDRWQIPKSDYTIHAGFDEPLIQSGVGYLEQIHVFLSADSIVAASATSADSPLLTELGRLFSPFSSVLFTEFSLLYLPVFKDDGSIWEFDEFVFATALKLADVGTSVETSLVMGSFSETSSMANGAARSTDFRQGADSGNGNGEQNDKRRSEKGKERNRGDEDRADKGDRDSKDPEDDPEDPSGNRGGTAAEHGKISFEIGSKIYLPMIQSDEPNVFQTITMLGSLTIKTTPLALAERPRRFSERHIQFDGLVFSTQPTTEVAYKQFHVIVAVDSQQENARVMSLKPKTTRDTGREEKRWTSTKTGRVRGVAGSAALAVGDSNLPRGLISGTATHCHTEEETVGAERTRHRSGITAHPGDGVVRWGFNVDDVNLQTWGIDMPDDVLPSASFEFVGDSDVPAPPPKCVHATIVSHWSIILFPGTRTRSESKRNWIRKLLGVFKPSSSQAQAQAHSGSASSEPNSNTISYSNLFQLVALKADTSRLQDLDSPHSCYKAKLEVRLGTSGPPEVKRAAAESVEMIPAVVDDLRKLSSFNLGRSCNDATKFGVEYSLGI